MLITYRLGRPGRGPGSWAGPGLFAMVLVFLGALPAAAGTLDIVVENSKAVAGTSGSFEVDLRINTSSVISIAGFGIDVALPSDTSLVGFSGIDKGTVQPYIFAATGSFDGGILTALLPLEASANDTSAAIAGQALNPGDVFGLAHITYVVDPSAVPGTTFAVSLLLDSLGFSPPQPRGTSLSDGDGNLVPFNMVNGTITVQGSGTVPEPAAVTLLGISGVVLLVVTRSARRAE